MVISSRKDGSLVQTQLKCWCSDLCWLSCSLENQAFPLSSSHMGLGSQVSGDRRLEVILVLKSGSDWANGCDIRQRIGCGAEPLCTVIPHIFVEIPNCRRLKQIDKRRSRFTKEIQFRLHCLMGRCSFGTSEFLHPMHDKEEAVASLTGGFGAVTFAATETQRAQGKLVKVVWI